MPASSCWTARPRDHRFRAGRNARGDDHPPRNGVLGAGPANAGARKRRAEARIPRHEPDERRAPRHRSRSPTMTDESLEIPASPSPDGAPQPAATETAPEGGAPAATGALVLKPPAPVEAVPSTTAEESIPIS